MPTEITNDDRGQPRAGEMKQVAEENEVLWGVLRAIGLAALPALIELLNSPDWRYRSAAASLLGEFGPAAEPAVPVLLRALRDDDYRVRISAGYSLEGYFNWQPGMRKSCKAPRGVPPPIGANPDQRPFVEALVACANDSHPNVRVMAVGLLGRLGHTAQSALPLIVERLNDEDKSVRYYARQALLQIDPETAANSGVTSTDTRQPDPG